MEQSEAVVSTHFVFYVDHIIIPRLSVYGGAWICLLSFLPLLPLIRSVKSINGHIVFGFAYWVIDVQYGVAASNLQGEAWALGIGAPILHRG